MAYENTTVTVGKSQGLIRDALRASGASMFTFGEHMDEEGVRHAAYQFLRHGLVVRVQVPLRPVDPKLLAKKQRNARSKSDQEVEDELYAQEERRIWRVLWWGLKTRLEEIEEGVLTFEQAFLPHLVDPTTGRTVWDHLEPSIASGALQQGGVGLRAIEATTS